MWPPCTRPPIWLCRPHPHCQGSDTSSHPPGVRQDTPSPVDRGVSSDGLPSRGSRVPCPLFFCLTKLCEAGSWAGAGGRCPQGCWGVGDVALAVGRSPPAGGDVACIQSTGPWDPSGTADRDRSPPAAGPPVGLSGNTRDNEAGSTVCLMARRGRVMCRWAVSPAGLGGAQQDPCGLRRLGPCCAAGQAGFMWGPAGSGRARAKERCPTAGGGSGGAGGSRAGLWVLSRSASRTGVWLRVQCLGLGREPLTYPGDHQPHGYPAHRNLMGFPRETVVRREPLTSHSVLTVTKYLNNV